MKKALFIILTCSLQLVASGFVSKHRSIYFKIEYNYEFVDQAFDEDGNTIPGNIESGFKEIETSKSNIFIAYGLFPRFSVSTNVQFIDTELTFPISGSQSRNGFSDIWVNGHYLIMRKSFDLVLNVGGKIPLEDNIARFPQITNGEPYYQSSLGWGLGQQQYYLEAEAGYRFRTGTINNVEINGIPYEDEWFGSFKVGYHANKWEFDSLITGVKTTADIKNENFVAGIFSNSDELQIKLGVERKLFKNNSFGFSFQQKVWGRNTLLTQSLGINWVMIW